MDNWYTSVKYTHILKDRGLYCRGPLRSNRAHTPTAILFTKSDIKTYPPGTWRQAVAKKLGLVVCSLLDENVVTILSNCDGTLTSHVKRRMGNELTKQKCPRIIPNDNANMQGYCCYQCLRSSAKGQPKNQRDGHMYFQQMLAFDLCQTNFSK